MLVTQKWTFIWRKSSFVKCCINLILCYGRLGRGWEEVMADPISKAHILNRLLPPACQLVNLSTCQERVESFNLKHFISQSILSWVPPDRLKIFAVDIHRLHLCYVLSVILFVFLFCVFCFLLCFISHTYFLCLCFVFSVMFYQSWFLCFVFWQQQQQYGSPVSTLGGSNWARPPWLVLGRLCPTLKEQQGVKHSKTRL